MTLNNPGESSSHHNPNTLFNECTYRDINIIPHNTIFIKSTIEFSVYSDVKHQFGVSL